MGTTQFLTDEELLEQAEEPEEQGPDELQAEKGSISCVRLSEL